MYLVYTCVVFQGCTEVWSTCSAGNNFHDPLIEKKNDDFSVRIHSMHCEVLDDLGADTKWWSLWEIVTWHRRSHQVTKSVTTPILWTHQLDEPKRSEARHLHCGTFEFHLVRWLELPRFGAWWTSPAGFRLWPGLDGTYVDQTWQNISCVFHGSS